jgi:hypothetical protein
VDVAPRLEALVLVLPELFAALRLVAVLVELLWAEPLDPLLEPAEDCCEDEECDELPVLLDELDEDAAAGAAALGGGGATGVEIMDSRPTRGHSLRPDAL